jgi:putative ABC transport system permease protein
MRFDSLLQDIRFGLRLLWKDKAFSALAVLVLACGIGGVTTQFAVVNAVALRGLSFPHPEQLMSVGLIDPQASGQSNNYGIGAIPSMQDYEDLRRGQTSFAQLAAYLYGATVNVTYGKNPQRYTGAYVTEDFFRILGVAPMIGRDFTANDNALGAQKVAILSHEAWQRDFNSDPNIVGQSAQINGKAAIIVGVMPPNFRFPVSEQIWVPYYNEFPLKPRGQLMLGANNSSPDVVMGRLNPGVTIDRANTEFVALARRIAQDNPKTNQMFVSASVQPLLHGLTSLQLRQQVWGMLAAVILVLLIACVNVMNMQFGRVTLRSQEWAIRCALGATHWRIVRQMLIESLLIAAAGAFAGMALAYWAVGMLVRAAHALPVPLPYWIQFTIDAPAFAFTIVVTLLATIVSGLAPAWVGTHGAAAETLKEGGGRGNTGRLVNTVSRALVVGQIALTAALLVAATLEIKSIRNQLLLNYGYDERAVFTARAALLDGAYPTQSARRQFFLRALSVLPTNPHFDSVALSSRFRMTFDGRSQYEIDGQKYVQDHDRPSGNYELISNNYFSTLGMKVLDGRDFTVDDTDAKQPVAIVNASFARRHWGNESAIGRRVRIYNPAEPQPWRTIVGVVPDTLMQGPLDPQSDTAGFYMPLLGAESVVRLCTIIVRPRPGESAATLGPALKKAISDLDNNLPTYFAGTPAELHDEALASNRLITTLFAIFGGVAFALSGVGLYGVMSFAVNQRTQEFGIRMALGADAMRILRLVMGQGAWQLAIGLALGAGGVALLGAIAAAALKNVLFKVNPLDPTIYAAVAALLTVVCAVSCFVPARRATRVDPAVVWRHE